MPRPKKEDKKPVAEKPKVTAKRRKDKEEDHDDLEEFEEKPEKKLKVEGKKEGNEKKAKIYILAYADSGPLESVHSGTHTFIDLEAALEFREGLIKKFEAESYEEFGSSGIPSFDKKSKEHVYHGDYGGGHCSIIIKEVTVDELLAGKDISMDLW